jgi:CBS domain containing-hemolysin-like protein
MDRMTLWAFAGSLLLVLANAFFVASEFAIVKVRRTQLETLAKTSRRARTALKISQNLDAYLSANQLGVTLASLGLGWVGERAFASVLEHALGGSGARTALVHTIASVLAFILITFLHTVLGELAPKSLAIQKAEWTALWSARPLHLFYLVFYPLIWLLNSSARLVLRLFGLRAASEAAEAHSAAELKLVLAASHAHGVLDESTASLMDHALDFRSRSVRTVMTPRPELLTLSIESRIEEAVRITAESAYSRFPVLSQTEGRDRLLGFVLAKDLFAHVAGVRPAATLRQLVREPIFIPETMTLDRVRRLMQRRRVHVAFVLDEYANFVGMASLEDVMEALVGPIEDEQDEPHAQEVVRQPDGSIEVDGSLPLPEARRLFEFQDYEQIGGIDTLGGYVFAVLEHPPKLGDIIRIGSAHEATVIKVEHFRVRRLLLRSIPSPDGAPAQKEE